MTNQEDIQGRFLGMPYDFRRPTWSKIKRRCWQPGGKFLQPRVFGVGWVFNLAHPATWLLVGGLVALAVARWVSVG